MFWRSFLIGFMHTNSYSLYKHYNKESKMINFKPLNIYNGDKSLQRYGFNLVKKL